ncbi:MAG TPA: diguanylate cyclase [Thermoanaerobaculia bacterium]|nr:diguanylate cyclase [Thermoanaerobaculia bacterium]
MLAQPTITKARDAEPALDQQHLYRLGLDHVRRLARRIWTDHNVHDPGITTLELLTYALTDLTYRASFPVEDLIAGADDSSSPLFTARRILPNRPLTLLDYRKLLIDLKDVKNAWIEPEEQIYWADPLKGELLWEDSGGPGVREVHLRGLYRVRVELMEGVEADRMDEVLEAVMETLQANRNLCEDFVEIVPVEQQGFVLCAELELAPDADVSRVEADVLFQVSQYLAPPVSNYSLSEMLERYSAQEIFDGPVLEHGFIDDAELARADLRTEIRLSDVINIVMDIEGVRAVVDIVINPEGAETLANKWLVHVDAGRQPVLSRQGSRLVCYKRNMPVVANRQEVEDRFAELAAQARRKLETPNAYDLPVPRGRDRRTGGYHSFQNHFPALYGLGEVGLPSGASPKRQAQAFQLKAYLLFFDQVMADYCAQLARVKDLFATDPDLEQTCFHQVVDSFADFGNIYEAGMTVDKLQEGEEAVWIERRNRFLDHLIARFAERFHDYASIMRSAFGAGEESLIPVKGEFLRGYPERGAERGLAYNHTLKDPEDLWNTDKVSGLERRVASLLGIPNASRRNLSEVPDDLHVETAMTPGDEYLFRVRHRETGQILLTSSTRYSTRARAKAAARRALHFAQMPASCERKRASDGKYYFNVTDDTGSVIARRIRYFDSPEQANAAIEELTAYVRTHYSEEGMFLIENILLRPEREGERFLPICVDPNCSDCAEDDPYSYRVHIVLPAFAGRFNNMSFRRFAEEVIREETPAHILPRICWAGSEDMAKLDGAYRAWLEARAKGSNDHGARLAELIDILYRVKSVYPSQRLVDCDCGEEEPKFILGQTALGSAESNEE